MPRVNSWARPQKRAAAPPPLYLLPGGESTPYCHRCGRVIGKTPKNSNDVIKYCSDRCRRQKLDEGDREIERVFVALLEGTSLAHQSPAEIREHVSSPEHELQIEKSLQATGGPQKTVLCSTVQTLLFGGKTQVRGERKGKKKRGGEEKEWKSVDMVDEPAYAMSYADEDSEAVAAETTESQPEQAPESTMDSQEARERSLEGQQRAEEREAVRRAARRLCAFGAPLPVHFGQIQNPSYLNRKKSTQENNESQGKSKTPTRKKCEPVLRSGTIVEASYAKGDWGVRWRE